MRIAFYAPLKAPDHPVPSGDREMARLLIAALGHAGHEVTILSIVRAFAARPDPTALEERARAAGEEVTRLAEAWTETARRPDLIFTYHLYYKAPDLVGLPLARRFGIPYATAEASFALKRASGPWTTGQAAVAEAVRAARLNLCFTANDRAGLAHLVGEDRLADLPPFIDASRFSRRADPRGSERVELVTVAMMRPGDKRDSYRFLAAALGRLPPSDWRLTIVGDGPERAAIERDFVGVPGERIRFVGALSGDDVSGHLRAADLFVWPGFNEAFGLSYLEAQASGLPVVALTGEGTPSVVRHGETGLLTPADPDAYAAAVGMLIADHALRQRFGDAAFRFAHTERSLPVAAARLDAALTRALNDKWSS